MEDFELTSNSPPEDHLARYQGSLTSKPIRIVRYRTVDSSEKLVVLYVDKAELLTGERLVYHA
jgi:hypothetical protein